MKGKLYIGGLALLSAAALAAVTVNEGPYKLVVSNTVQTAEFATEAACIAERDVRIASQPLNVTRTYRCQRTFTAVRTADPVPTPVNCAGSWSQPVVSEWLPLVCSNGTQTQTSTRTFTVTTQPSNGGLSCPTSPEVTTSTRTCTVDPEEPPPTGNDSNGAWNSKNFANGPYRINFNLPGSYTQQSGPYPIWLTGGATHANLPGAWDGTNYAHIFPPTSQGTYSAIGALGGIAMPNGGAVKSASFRWEFRTGDSYASDQQRANGHKFSLIHIANSRVNGSIGLARVMLNMQHTHDNTGCATVGIAAGTVTEYNHKSNSGQWTQDSNPNGTNDLVRWCDVAKTIPGNPQTTVIPPGEWVTMEIFVDVRNSTSAKMCITVTRRNGQVPLNQCIPWRFDSNWSISGQENINDANVIGGYWSNVPPRTAGSYFDLANLTVAVGNTSQIGPKANFRQ